MPLKLRMVEERDSSIDRRTFILRASLVLPAMILGSATVNAEGSAALADPFTSKEYNDVDNGFSLQLPSRYFKSKRGSKTGTLFVAGDLKTTEILSVQKISIEQLLSDVGVIPTGDLSTWPAIGSAEKVAELLASKRDGDAKQQNGLPSKVDPSSVKSDDKILQFVMLTPIGPSSLEDTTPLTRVTTVRAVLLPQDKQALVVWGSALEEEWKSEASKGLKEAMNSFRMIL